MKKIGMAILRCVKAKNKSDASYFKYYPKLKDLALEQHGNSPLEKAAFALYYFFIDNDDNNYLPPIEILEGVLFYLDEEKLIVNNIENMYKKLSNAFQTKKSIEDIQSILQENTTLVS